MIRVRMPYRRLKVEEDTHYVPTIYNIVKERAKGYNSQFDDLSKVNVHEIKPIFESILRDLAFGIYVTEHRLRYQQEQKERYYKSLKSFSYWRTTTVEDFIKDYNSFIQQDIKKSHFGLSPKIEANYRRNYHEDASAVTSTVFYLYFKTDKVKQFFAGLLYRAYRNPLTDRQKVLI
jgi:hypothetical protein